MDGYVDIYNRDSLIEHHKFYFKADRTFTFIRPWGELRFDGVRY